MSLHVHSLVAYILSIIVISKVISKDPSRLNQNSETSEHNIPGIPAQDSTTCTTLHMDL